MVCRPFVQVMVSPALYMLVAAYVMPKGDGPRVNIFAKTMVGIPGNRLPNGELMPRSAALTGCDGVPGP